MISIKEKQRKKNEKQNAKRKIEMQRQTNNHTVDNISIQGYSHKLNDKECQDNSLSWKGNNYSGIIVCDGHGGDKYVRSAIGSKIACAIGKIMASEYMSHLGNDFFTKSNHQIESELTRLECAIVNAWYAEIEKHYSEKPIEEDARFKNLEQADKDALIKNLVKAYGSTFILAVMSDKISFVLKLGDGDATILYSNGEAEAPDELIDEELQFNMTTSLCNSDAAVSFHHCFRKKNAEKRPVGIILTSDGVINSYRSVEAYHSFIKNVFEAYGEDDLKIAHSELEETLNTLSEKGSGDDLSVAIVRKRE